MLKSLKTPLGDLKSGPIILTCYTNHALDQFLEHCSEFTREIVRIGGRSKNVNFKDFSISAFAKRKK